MQNKRLLLLAIGFIGVSGLAYAAAPAMTGGRTGGTTAPGAAPTARMVSMPSMPGLGGAGVGNLQTQNLPTGPGVTNPPPPPPPPPPTPCPDGSARPSNGICLCPDGTNMPSNGVCPQVPGKCPDGSNRPSNGICLCPDGTTMPANGKCPSAPSECPDGGVRNSTYTVDNCMNDVLTCVNGTLPGGLNDLYNPDLRFAIENGMNLCAPQVDFCIKNVRKNCRNVYRSAANVWIDFNSRVVQPSYFAFILRKTGLTPNQAENTCLLLDRNTYGTSFAAVANSGATTTEYNRMVMGFGGLGPSKDNPMGATVNTGHPGVDGQRGHYARWDATTGECLIRVAAYHNNNLITNKWLFGGDDRNAEAWRPAGTSFGCNRDLFGFGLLTNTKDVAAVGIGGGTLVGAGTGAIIGAARKNTFDCDAGDLKDLAEEIRSANLAGGLSIYMHNEITSAQLASSGLTFQQCRDILALRDMVSKAKNDPCFNAGSAVTAAVDHRLRVTTTDGQVIVNESANRTAGNNQCVDWWVELITSNSLRCPPHNSDCVTTAEFTRAVNNLESMLNQLPSLEGRDSKAGQGALIGAGVGAGAGGLATLINSFIERDRISCRIGDDLGRVSYNRSGKIDSLKDFYIKWNLELPDTIMPTGKVTDCKDWQRICGTFREAWACNAVQINYHPADAKTATLIDTACRMQGSVCTVNMPVAISHGACEE